MKIGKGGLTFEAGPFQSFGTEVMETMWEICSAQTQGYGEKHQLSASSMALPPKEEAGGSFRKKVEFIPDFTVFVKTDVTYLIISANTYLSAYRLSLIENHRGTLGSG